MATKTREAPGTVTSQPIAVTPEAAEVNTLTTAAAWEAANASCHEDPGAFHGAIARRELHWFDPAIGKHGA